MPPKRKSTTSKPAGRKVAKREKWEASSEEEEEQVESEEEQEEVEGTVDTPVKYGMNGKFGLEWHSIGSTFFFLDSKEIKHSSKVIGFDMDGTLLNPKSGAKFPKNRNDWKWLYPEVTQKLKELHEEGTKVVIFTNQGGIEKKNQKPEDIFGKILDLTNELGFPIQAYVAAATNHWRKPNTTMWDYMASHRNGGVAVDLTKCMYVGDAAGRAKGWNGQPKCPKDFSCGDRTFAFNLKVEFATPEEFFLSGKKIPFTWDGIDPAALLDKLTASPPVSLTQKEIIPGDSQELVVFVGCPAAGKSTFARSHFVPKGYEHVNQDTLKTKEKCIKATIAALEAGKSVVVDNTNPSPQVRAEYLSIAKSLGIPARCFVFVTDVDLAHHLNFYREKLTKGKVRRVPDVGYNMFKKNFQEPSTSEGFSSVLKVPWTPYFASEEDRRLFLQRTC